MRMQRFIARDMRSALAQVRESLGPDAVILSSGKSGDEVEVVAAIDAEVARAVETAPPARQYARETIREVPTEPVRGATRFEPPQAHDPRNALADAAKHRRA